MRKNKLNILASAVSLAALSAAPIISLTSCSCFSSGDITIDENDKHQTLDKGVRYATFNMKLSKALSDGEKLTCEIKNITSTQSGYTIRDKSFVFTTGKTEVALTVAIETDSNDLLKEGAKFGFNLQVKKMDKDGKQVFSNDLNDFSVTYSVPTTTGISINEEEKTAYSNPGEKTHVYEFSVGESVTIDESCEFGCDTSILSSNSNSVGVKFVSAKYSATTKKIAATFTLDSSSELSEGDYVRFDINLSCSKEGKELWRQKINDLKLEYLEHQLWVFDSHQWNFTYAGEKQFHLYVVRNQSVTKDMLTAQNILVTSKTQGVTLSYNFNDISQPSQSVSGYYYFDIPVTISSDTEFTEDTLIYYEVKLQGTVGIQSFDQTFNRQIKYHVQKATEQANKADYLVHDKTFNLVFTNVAHPSEDCHYAIEVQQTQGPSRGAGKVVAKQATWADGNLTVNFEYETTATLSEKLKFKMIVKCLDSNNESLWEQRTSEYTYSYVEPIYVNDVTLTDKSDADYATLYLRMGRSIGTLDGSLVANSLQFADGGFNPTKYTDLENCDWSEIKSINQGSPYIDVTLNSGSKKLSYKSAVEFNLTISGKTRCSYAPNGYKEWKYTISNKKIEFNGTISDVYSSTPKVQVSQPGENLVHYKFDLYGDEDTLNVQMLNEVVTEGYHTEITKEVKNHVVDITAKLVNNSGEPVVDGASSTFDLQFNGTRNGVVWTKEAFKNFSVTYKSGITCQRPDFETEPGDGSGVLSLIDINPTDGYTYEASVINQQTPDIKAKISGAPAVVEGKINVKLELEKGSPLEEGDTSIFDLVVTKYDENHTVISTDKISNCSLKYTTNPVVWKDGWYVYEEDTYEHTAGPVNAEFILKNEIGEGEKLSCTITSTGGSTNVSVKQVAGSEISIEGKKVKVPVQLSKVDSNFIVGDYGMYSITFKCTKDGADVWSHTITDCYVYAFGDIQPLSKDIKTDDSTNISFTMSILFGQSIPSSLNITTYSNVTQRVDVPEDITVITDSKPTWDQVNGLRLGVKWSSTTGVQANAKIVFDLKFVFTYTFDNIQYTAQYILNDYNLIKKS